MQVQASPKLSLILKYIDIIYLFIINFLLLVYFYVKILYKI